MKAKILLKDYKKSLENFKEYSNREYYNLCKEISKDIKQKWYNNFYDYLNLITLSEEGIFNMLYPYSDNINKLALKNYFKLESVYIDLDKIQKRIDSLELVQEDFVYVDSKELEFVNLFKNII